MASIFDSLKYGGHGVAESTLMLATECGGHFYNMVSDEDVDNGSVVQYPTPEKWKENDYFEAVKPAITDKIALVLTPVKIYQEYTRLMQEDEGNFYNAAGERMRVYEVYPTDRFSLNKDAFAEDADPKKGAYVCVKADSFKLTTKESDPSATNGFVGQIIQVNPNGTFDVFVKKNEALA
ncbi:MULTISPECIES: hypothetical protein [unclassified Ruminococcus]|jgi:hypothetical protein|uniref:hypothetical protein n=1 Tax=unclassified Ruminococcus TaxID=2608920 RepID=UPI0018A04645|nr:MULTISPECIES: hypothetical protein [unclassified Ruminococcus]DAU20584.1 MAG TPA: hypothetical protein [Caudoviricetes sp.]MDB8755750.1 hypothetical protein [Ruminococcus sp. 1001136sp1]MDB8759852.1 hypothetical protein [Ruminococcus sp. 1001136sp1]MDB8763908.1 hypothetical protein [Ruminococcus sp. 1001136sp1]MDB8767590.1 hypothetical protein [Ruminococcus sp. 1001136sp1]